MQFHLWILFHTLWKYELIIICSMPCVLINASVLVSSVSSENIEYGQNSIQQFINTNRSRCAELPERETGSVGWQYE